MTPPYEWKILELDIKRYYNQPTLTVSLYPTENKLNRSKILIQLDFYEVIYFLISWKHVLYIYDYYYFGGFSEYGLHVPFEEPLNPWQSRELFIALAVDYLTAREIKNDRCTVFLAPIQVDWLESQEIKGLDSTTSQRAR